jgi:hypothetical protein
MHQRFLSTLLLAGIAAFGTAMASEVVLPSDNGMPIPHLVLVGHLAQTISIKSCKLISGLTCRICLKSGQELPTRIYSTEVDHKGKKLGPRQRVTYPDIRPGQCGLATLSLQHDSSKLVIQGVWRGAWQSPY